MARQLSLWIMQKNSSHFLLAQTFKSLSLAPPMICGIYLCVVVAKRPLPEEEIPKRCYAGRNLVVLKKNRTLASTPHSDLGTLTHF